MTAAGTATGELCIVIACYNQAHFLDDAIGSVLRQRYENVEIIVVDDGSSDAAAALVCDKYPSVRYVRKANGGLSSARNAGLALTTRPIVSFLDADDLYCEGAFAIALETLRQNPQAAFSYGGHMEVDAQRNPLFEIEVRRVDDLARGLLEGNFISMHAVVFYRREILAGIGGFDERLGACEDYDAYFRIAYEHQAAAYDFCAAEYRRHGSNMTGNSALMLKQSLAVLRAHRNLARRSAAHQRAYETGVKQWRSYYGNRLARQLVARPSDLRLWWSSLVTGFREDPLFAARLGRRVGVRIVRAVWKP
jgi:glycosyltransferase involved in cell wall biosynthesis